ncbi:MAG: DUF6884 domain-containing protein [Candidatus Zixiibacteriota bacterium]
MRVFCTFCSKDKSDASGLLPAIDRYLSDRIRGVHECAIADKVELFILSGKYGLIHCDTKIPWYDQFLNVDQRPKIIQQVKWQLADYSITQVTYYTRLPEDDPRYTPYNRVIEEACRSCDIILEKRFWIK